MTAQELVNKAVEATRGSYSPYSGFTVGAALLCEDGEVFTAANVENASYSATMCGERNALFYAAAQGKRKFTAVAIVGGHLRRLPSGLFRILLTRFQDLPLQRTGDQRIHPRSAFAREL